MSSFWFTEAYRRQFLPAGLYGQPLDALALNLANAATAGRLKLDLIVANSSFVATNDTLMDKLSMTGGGATGLLATTGLARHQGASYVSKPISTVVPGKDDTLNKITFPITDTLYQWLALEAASAGYSLRAAVGFYDNLPTFDLPVFWYDGGNVNGLPMLGGDVNVSLPALAPGRSQMV